MIIFLFEILDLDFITISIWIDDDDKIAKKWLCNDLHIVTFFENPSSATNYFKLTIWNYSLKWFNEWGEYVHHAIFANYMHCFNKSAVYCNDTTLKKFIKAVQMVKYLLSELSFISSIQYFDKEKCLFWENKLTALNRNFKIFSIGSTLSRN